MNKTKIIAYCGLLSAVSVAILFLASLIGIGVFAGPILASLCLLPLLDTKRPKEALMVYAVSAILGVLLLPDRELSLFYLLMGWYPAGLEKIHKIKSNALQYILKLLIYTAIVFLLYGVILGLIGIDPGLLDSAAQNAVMYAAGAIIFLMLDRYYERMTMLFRRLPKMK